ncbi:hypothetical protein BDP27DRAFT_1319066 [Rhodocollybia butyracea]|uniref:Uncharacterized protein n=1 Tax=Rhodocollybia butyracea TaxID=206335 RepID=A0A9P5Q434_9AGAR|nr:hypothetical protein BDP27DRAFT_1319066 [Rhodocollybia butyracea]
MEPLRSVSPELTTTTYSPFPRCATPELYPDIDLDIAYATPIEYNLFDELKERQEAWKAMFANMSRAPTPDIGRSWSPIPLADDANGWPIREGFESDNSSIRTGFLTPISRSQSLDSESSIRASTSISSDSYNLGYSDMMTVDHEGIDEVGEQQFIGEAIESEYLQERSQTDEGMQLESVEDLLANEPLHVVEVIKPRAKRARPSEPFTRVTRSAAKALKLQNGTD